MYFVTLCMCFYVVIQNHLYFRENFERLLDDKSFKVELVNFSVAEDTAAIQEQHRADLLPVLMRYS